VWGVNSWGVNSTVTKYSDYFFWKDTSECVARRCDDTVDRKRVNSCVLKHLFLEIVEQPKEWPKNPEMLSPTRYWCDVFKISKKKTPQTAGFMELRFMRFWLIHLFESSRGKRFLQFVLFTSDVILIQKCLRGSNPELHGLELVLTTAPPRMHISRLDTCVLRPQGIRMLM